MARVGENPGPDQPLLAVAHTRSRISVARTSSTIRTTARRWESKPAISQRGVTWFLPMENFYRCIPHSLARRLGARKASYHPFLGGWIRFEVGQGPRIENQDRSLHTRGGWILVKMPRIANLDMSNRLGGVAMFGSIGHATQTVQTMRMVRPHLAWHPHWGLFI